MGGGTSAVFALGLVTRLADTGTSSNLIPTSIASPHGHVESKGARTDMRHKPIEVLFQYTVVVEAEVLQELPSLGVYTNG